MPETDLYPPLKRFLEGQGYEVKAEIRDCDVLAVRGDEPPVVVELKLNLNLDVILQAVDRLSISPKVYIGVPVRCKILNKRGKRITKMLKMLGIGLVVIDPNPGGLVSVHLDPGEYRPKISKAKQGRLLGEFVKRVGDPNQGGASRRKGVMTAYRQRALAVAAFLQEHGPTKASDIAKALDEPKARDIVYRDVYGWFERISLGVYAITPRGVEESTLWRG